MIVVGIDPGRSTGYCVIHDDETIEAGILRSSTDWERIWGADLVIIERPEIYPNTPNYSDIITLALTAGEIAGKFKANCHGEVKYVLPKEWKRQLPKEVCWKRVQKLLTPRQVEMLAGIENLPHDARDAVGIALYGKGKKVYV